MCTSQVADCDKNTPDDKENVSGQKGADDALMLRKTGISSALDTWRPTFDWSETEGGGFVITAATPGLSKDELHVEIVEGDGSRGTALIVSGESAKTDQKDDDKTKSFTSRYSKFSHTIRLPSKVKTDDIKAKYEDGLLTINVKPPAAEVKKAERIALPIA